MKTQDRRDEELADRIGRLGWGPLKEREAAARELAASADARAIDPLLAVMNQHEDWGLVQAAAHALAKLDEAGVDGLITVVTESDRWRRFDTPFYKDRGRGLALSAPDPRESYDIVRTHAAEALAEAKAVRARRDVCARAVEVIVGLLVRQGRGPTREALSEALKKLGFSASAIERLEKEARSERRRSSDPMESTAADGGEADPPQRVDREETHDVAQLLELLGKAFRQNDLQAADRIGRSLREAATADVDGLVHGLSDANPLVRDTVVEVLGDVGGVEALPALREALDDDDDQLRVVATKAIERIMSRATQDVAQLLKLLREAFRDIRPRSVAARCDLGRRKGEIVAVAMRGKPESASRAAIDCRRS